MKYLYIGLPYEEDSYALYPCRRRDYESINIWFSALDWYNPTLPGLVLLRNNHWNYDTGYKLRKL
jgi:hypothetical protein